MNITNPEIFLEVWYIFAIVYFVFFWAIPMLGMSANKWVNEAARGSALRKSRYWSGVRFFSGCFHVAAVLAGVLMHFLNPYLFPGV